MIGDHIHIKPHYFQTAKAIEDLLPTNKDKLVVGISGESGSGKSVTAVCLAEVLTVKGIHCCVMHLDDFFILPPYSNHQNRLKSLKNVGIHEIDWIRLNNTVEDFKNKKSQSEKPLVNYQLNQIIEETIVLDGIDVMIIEGSYAFETIGIDFHVFMERTYQETKEQRIARGRGNEFNDPFVEEVLAIEHQIISPQLKHSNVVVQKDYSVKLLQS